MKDRSVISRWLSVIWVFGFLYIRIKREVPVFLNQNCSALSRVANRLSICALYSTGQWFPWMPITDDKTAGANPSFLHPYWNWYAPLLPLFTGDNAYCLAWQFIEGKLQTISWNISAHNSNEWRLKSMDVLLRLSAVSKQWSSLCATGGSHLKQANKTEQKTFKLSEFWIWYAE